MAVTNLNDAKDKKMDNNKSKALDAALSQIERAFGKGSIMKLGGEGAQALNVEAISTGSIGLDIALGIGGLPRGRVCRNLWARKVLVRQHWLCKSSLRLKNRVEHVHLLMQEHALDPVYAKKLGCNVEDLLISQPDAG